MRAVFGGPKGGLLIFFVADEIQAGRMKFIGEQSKYAAIVILFLGSLAVVWNTLPIWQHQNLNDDSFITLTYAKNLAAGNGFVFNHPPATLGTTTPLFTMAVALLARLTPFDVAEAAIFFSVIAWIGVGWILYFIFRQTAFSSVAAAVAAVTPLLLGQGWRGFVGMEIWPFQFLLLLSVYLAINRKMLYAGIVVGALFLTRGEGALMGGILFVYLWYQERKVPVKFLVGAGSVVVIWIVYAMLTFGTFLPNTLAAKQAQAQLPSGRNFIERMMLELLPNYIGWFGFLGKWFLNPYLILSVAGILYTAYRARTLLLFMAWGGAYLAGYTILNPKPYYWYMLNIAFILLVFVGVGLAGLITLAFECKTKAARISAGTVAVILEIALFSFAARFMVNAPNYPGDHRALPYKALSAWLKENTQPSDSVAFIEIGYLGYFTDNRIIDLGGLIDPEATKHLVSDGFSWAFWQYRPDYYIYAEEFDWALGDIKPALESEYEPVYQVSRDYQPAPIYVYKRKSK